VIALVVLADGAEVLLFRAGGAARSARPAAEQIAHGGPVSYARFLSWRGLVEPEPPRRPSPERPSSSAAARNDDWKFAFVGSRDRGSGAIHLPPSRTSIKGGAVDEMDDVPMSEAVGTVVTSTIDKLAYSVNPPIVFAVVDFDGGGRMPVELTDVDPDDVSIGDRIEMTFRRLYVADGISNYFWKGRPVRAS
ncbi:MAG: OB-fold domain-containing protein, partial [Acidimicrobiia bacterium]|nr:OB-fold domain-containing protein [Acidimicrobiia bacterium]